MTRLGKKPIELPAQTECTVLPDGMVTVKGPKGTLSRTFKPDVSIVLEGNILTLKPARPSRFAQVLWGTYASHIRNMVQGVHTPYEKKLIIEGVGFKWEVSGKTLKIAAGFSHPVILDIPEGVTVTVEKSELTVSGIDKEAVGSFAANIRAVKKPEPYKGKGIRYHDEIIRRKQGKKSA